MIQWGAVRRSNELLNSVQEHTIGGECARYNLYISTQISHSAPHLKYRKIRSAHLPHKISSSTHLENGANNRVVARNALMPRDWFFVCVCCHLLPVPLAQICTGFGKTVSARI